MISLRFRQTGSRAEGCPACTAVKANLKDSLTNLLYFSPHLTAASSGLDFQEGIPDLPVLIELALRQLSAEVYA